MIGLTNAQREIQHLLMVAICTQDLKIVQEMFNSNGNDGIQAALRHERAQTILYLAITYLETVVEDKEKLEKSVKIIKLLWDKTSPDVRNSWLEDCMVNKEGQNTGGNYMLDSLEKRQEMYGNIAGEGWVKDFIQEVKDYKKSREEELSKRVLEDIEEKEPIAGNETPGNSDTTFWSKHKGKIALGVTGLCVAGAIAAYMLAYPAVALALTVLAAVILMGAGIAKVLEDPSVEKPFTPQQEVQR